MSLWGKEYVSLLLPINIKKNLHLSFSNNKKNFLKLDKITSNLMEIFIGILDGDGYIEIGPQKQYNKNNNLNKPKSTIRVRIVLRLHKNDKELLDLIKNKLKIGKLDELKNINQYRLMIYKTDILNTIFPYLEKNNIEFLTYNRRKQFFLLKYIIENNIKHWESLNLEEIESLFIKNNKKLNFQQIINLPYFYNWLIGFTIAEGSFHIKSNGRAHFSIVQSGLENYQIIKAIHYFIKGPLSLQYKIKPENFKVYRISFSSKIDLNIIINFFENNQLLGLKKLQFDNWKSYIFSNNIIKHKAPNINLTKISNSLSTKNNFEISNNETNNR